MIKYVDLDVLDINLLILLTMTFLQSLLKRGFTTPARLTTPVTLKHLPYEIGALEPVISGQTMEFHYGKHHRTYVNNLNKLSEQAAVALAAGKTSEHVKLCTAIKFNGGGHLNHEFFWETLLPIKEGGGELPAEGDDLRKMIEAEWGSIESFQEFFTTNTATL
jgi:Fe-Mn family superoxide dismutase